MGKTHNEQRNTEQKIFSSFRDFEREYFPRTSKEKNQTFQLFDAEQILSKVIPAKEKENQEIIAA
ncbi:hypothetical protein E4695_15100 [Alcaligenaceae bacterium 429]|nr:hypothetical protein E4695_15100 [Alcaligenaceae bacterium 429]